MLTIKFLSELCLGILFLNKYNRPFSITENMCVEFKVYLIH